MMSQPYPSVPLTTQLNPIEVKQIIEQSIAPNSLRAYVQDLAGFSRAGLCIPATQDAVCVWLLEHADCYCLATLKRKLASLAKAHRMAGHDDPTKSEMVRMCLRGIGRQHGKPQRQAAPLLKEDLIAILPHIPDTLQGKRDKALLMLGFCAALRRSELAAVKLEHLAFTKDGIILTIPRGKTDQTGTGRTVGIPFGRGRICPVHIIQDWITASNITQGYLFPACPSGISGVDNDIRLSDRSISRIIKRHVMRTNLNPAQYSGHSLRAGLATSAAQAGIPSWKIREQTGHKTDAMLARYIRNGSLFHDNAAGVF